MYKQIQLKSIHLLQMESETFYIKFGILLSVLTAWVICYTHVSNMEQLWAKQSVVWRRADSMWMSVYFMLSQSTVSNNKYVYIFYYIIDVVLCSSLLYITVDFDIFICYLYQLNKHLVYCSSYWKVQKSEPTLNICKTFKT